MVGEWVFNLFAAKACLAAFEHLDSVNDTDIRKLGYIVITNQRLLHATKMMWQEDIEQIQLKDIINVEYKSSIIISVIRVQATPHSMDFDIPKDKAKLRLGLLVNFGSYPKVTIERVVL